MSYNPAVRTVYNVQTMFGAKGDGTTNNVSAIAAAVTAIKANGGGTLFFPYGTYAITTPGSHGIDLGTSASNIEILFDQGAEILMNNFTASNATSNGIYISGPATNISITNATVRFNAASASRGQYSGIYIQNDAVTAAVANYTLYTNTLITAKAINRIKIINPTVTDASGAAIVISGATDFFVSGATITRPLADGIFCSYVKSGTIDGVVVNDGGDDAVSMHTEIAISAVNTATLYLGSDAATFPWTGQGVHIDNVSAYGQGTGPGASSTSGALGIYGVRDVTYSNVYATGKGCVFNTVYGPYNSAYCFMAPLGITATNLECDGTNRFAVFNSIGNTLKSYGPRWQADISICNFKIRNCLSGAVIFTDSTTSTGWHSNIRFSTGTEVGAASNTLWSLFRAATITIDNVTTDAGVNFDTGQTGTPYQNITGTANNGSGLIRITVGATAGYVTGNPLVVSGVTGTTEANGQWFCTVIDGTHFDLQGSAYVHAYVSGGTASFAGVDLRISTATAQEWYFRGVWRANLVGPVTAYNTSVSGGLSGNAFEFHSAADVTCDSLETLYPQSGAACGAIDFDTYAKNITITSFAVRKDALTWAGAIKAVADNGYWFGTVQIITDNTSANAPFLSTAATAQYIRCNMYRWKALATSSNWQYGTQGTVALSAGTATVSNIFCTASTQVNLNTKVASTNGFLSLGTVTAGTSFVINSSNGGDSSTVSWQLIPAGN